MTNFAVYLANLLLPMPMLVSKVLSVCLALLNVVFPGIGLLLATLFQHGPVNAQYCLIAVLQFLTAFIAIGWVWAVINSVFWLVCLCGDKYDGLLYDFEYWALSAEDGQKAQNRTEIVAA